MYHKRSEIRYDDQLTAIDEQLDSKGILFQKRFPVLKNRLEFFKKKFKSLKVLEV
jgi:hypothetical protein